MELCSDPQTVSPDTAIDIVFGLIGALISFVGVIISCLTLRMMMVDKCIADFSASSFSVTLTCCVTSGHVIIDFRTE